VTRGVPFEPLLTDIKENQCGEFEVTWIQSWKDSGGGPVTRFQVQMKKSGDDWHNCTSFLTNHTCLFNGLQSKTVYDFRVRALNEKGWSNYTYASETSGSIGKKTRITKNWVKQCFLQLID